jgi:hypothetical protein
MSNFTKILILGVTLGLAACISGKPQHDTYTGKAGGTTEIQSDREQCEDACNDDYSRCMDSTMARSNPVPGSPPGMFGASSDCRDELKKCLPGCKSR